MPFYGDQESLATMNRAAYGDIPAAMMGAHGYGGYDGASDPLSAIGTLIRPVMYTPPVRYHSGYYGMIQQHTGVIRNLASIVGMESIPRGTDAQSYLYNTANDYGARSGGMIAGAATAAMGVGAGFLMEPAGAMAGRWAGGALGSMFGPAGTATGAVIGGFVGGAASYVVGMAAGAAVNKAASGRQEIQSFLDSNAFRFATAGNPMMDPRTGAGMSRGARTEMANFVRQQDLGDPMMGTQDLTQILEQGTQLGLFTGTQDMEDFQRKFKDITKNVKMISKVLHQTLSEGMKTIKDLKAIGITGGEVQDVMVSADVTGRMAGRTAAETLGMGLQGAEMFRGTGITMGIGAQATMMNLAAIRSSRDMGVLSQEAISQAGGEEALAMRRTAAGLSYTQSAMGRGMGAAFFNAGAPGAGFNNQAFMANMMAGGGNMLDMAGRAAANLSSPAALIQYQANQPKFLSEMGETFGGRGLQMAGIMGASSMAQMFTDTTGVDFESSFRYSMQQQGRSESEIEAAIGEARGAGGIRARAQESAAATRNKLLVDAAARRGFFNRIGKRVSNVVGRVYDPVSRDINAITENIKEGYVRFSDTMHGITRASVAGMNLSTVAGDASGVTSDTGPVDLDAAGTEIFGIRISPTAGSDMVDFARDNPEAARQVGLDYRTIKATESIPKGWNIGQRDGDTLHLVKINAQKAAAGPLASAEEADRMGVAGKFKDVRAAQYEDVDMSKITNIDQLSGAFFGGKKYDQLTKVQRALMVSRTRGYAGEILLDKHRKGQRIAREGVEAALVEKLARQEKVFEEATGEIEGRVWGMKRRTFDPAALDIMGEIAVKLEELDPELSVEEHKQRTAEIDALRSRAISEQERVVRRDEDLSAAEVRTEAERQVGASLGGMLPAHAKRYRARTGAVNVQMLRAVNLAKGQIAVAEDMTAKQQQAAVKATALASRGDLVGARGALKTFADTQYGRTMQASFDRARDIKDATKGMDQDRFDWYLKNKQHVEDKEVRKELWDNRESMGALFVQQDLLKKPGTTAVTAGAGGEVDTTDIMVKQANMNDVTYAAMYALAKKLGAVP